jgi:hypothetical protein
MEGSTLLQLKYRYDGLITGTADEFLSEMSTRRVVLWNSHDEATRGESEPWPQRAS